MDSKQLRTIFGQFATGVTVIGSHNGQGDKFGLTVNSFSSVSLDPPLIMFCIIRDSGSLEPIQQTEAFSVSILAADQENISNTMAKKGGSEKFDTVDTFTAETGAPVIKGNIGWLDCKLWKLHDGGDHLIVVGEVVAGETDEDDPLLFTSGRYARLAKD
ncbi:MAG: flavin reductase [Gammaproteobacteria bacterium]|nr:MAG: flavin reductase [Gammaproteobacteria bacterium]